MCFILCLAPKRFSLSDSIIDTQFFCNNTLTLCNRLQNTSNFLEEKNRLQNTEIDP